MSWVTRTAASAAAATENSEVGREEHDVSAAVSAERIFEELYNTYRIPGAYEAWADYRTRLTDYIIGSTAPGSSIAIVGAGESNDIDLARLYEHSGSLTLFDIDTDAMERAADRYGLCTGTAGDGTDRRGVRLCRCDLLGADREDYIRLIATLFGGASGYREALELFYLRVNGRTDSRRMTGHTDAGTPEKYDCVIMIGVHSQINSLPMRIWECCAELFGYSADDPGVFRAASTENAVLMPLVNDEVLAMTAGHLIVGLEACTLERPESGAVEGAYQAFMDLKERAERGALVCRSSYTDVWPLREGTSYSMTVLDLIPS